MSISKFFKASAFGFLIMGLIFTVLFMGTPYTVLTVELLLITASTILASALSFGLELATWGLKWNLKRK